MQEILSAAYEGLLLTISWPNILYPFYGTILVMIVSLLPGVSAVTLTTLIVPLILFWEPLQVMLLFGALVGGGTFMGSISAILLNIPGRNASAATMIDGYPMSQQGKAKTAIACAAAASALGSTVGILVLILLLPFAATLVVQIGPLEMTILILWGLSLVSVLVKGSVIKGLAMMGFGLAISCIGVDYHTAEPRMTYGLLTLYDGPPEVIIFLGMFAVAEVLSLAQNATQTISGKSRINQLTGSIREGLLSVFKHFKLFLRCSVIGTVVGILPGVGSLVAGFVAYAHAAQAGGGKFGKGDIRGVLAPESANDAKDGGGLIPVLTFGLPGGVTTALLLTTLSVHGIAPGRVLMTEHLTLVFVLIWSLFLSNWLTSILGLGGVSWFARITTVPARYLVPVVFGLIGVSAYAFRGQFFDLVLCMLFGLLGWFLKRNNWPRIPFVIAIVLGPHLETQALLVIKLMALDRIDFSSHPLVFFIGILTISGILLPIIRRGRSLTQANDSYPSLVLIMILLAVLVSMMIQLTDLEPWSMMFPLFTTVFTGILLIILFVTNIKQTSIGVTIFNIGNENGLKIFSITLMLPLFCLICGLIPGISIFNLVFTRFYLDYSRKQSLIAGVLTLLVSYGVLGLLLGFQMEWGLLSPAVYMISGN